MYLSCLVCQKTKIVEIAPFLCEECGQFFVPAKNRPRLLSLYQYRSVIRDLILSVKVRGNYRALLCLTELFVTSPLVKGFANSCCAIIPAPSSLWSRVRGRTDLAWHLAASLAKHYQKELFSCPLSLRWQIKKRSQMEKRKISLEFFNAPRLGEARFLIVDDVVTSGHTLSRVATALQEDSCHFLTLASALSHKKICNSFIP